MKPKPKLASEKIGDGLDGFDYEHKVKGFKKLASAKLGMEDKDGEYEYEPESIKNDNFPPSATDEAAARKKLAKKK